MLDSPIQARRWWSREDIFLLILLGVLLYLPGLARIPLFDRDEPRFATAAREMAETGDYLIPRFNGELRPDKPPMVYWLMNVSQFFVDRAGGSVELAARLPSAVCSTLTLIVLYLMVGSRFGRVTGIVAALIYGSSAAFVVESRLATADATMIFFTTVAMACAWRAWDAAGTSSAPLPRTDYLVDRGRGGDHAKPHIILDHLAAAPRQMSAGIAFLFWVALAAATLTKGVPLLFVFVPLMTLSLATGSLADLLKRWRSHLHITRARVAIALVIGAAVAAIVLGTYSSGSYSELRVGAVILGTIAILMAVTPGLPGVLFRCVIGANWRWWRELRPLWGFPLFLALVGWWVVAAWYATTPPGELITRMFGTHFLERTAGPVLRWLNIQLPQYATAPTQDPMRTYAQPPGFYLATVWVTFWPWSVLLVPAAYHATRRVLGKTAIAMDPRPYQFLVAWIIPMWVLLELARGKLFHYPLPILLAVAVLCADALVQSWHRLTDVLAAPWFAAMRWIVLAIWVGLGVGALWGAHAYLDPDLFWRTIPFGGALLATGIACAVAWGRPGWPFVLVLAWAGSLLIADSLILPEYPDFQLSRLAAHEVFATQGRAPDAKVAAVGYQEGSLIFYCRQHVTLTADWKSLVGSNEKWILVIDQPTRDAMTLANAEFYDAPGINHFVGRNSATLKPVSLYVVTSFAWSPATTGAASPATKP